MNERPDGQESMSGSWSAAFLSDHGYALLLVTGVLALAAGVVLVFQGHDANFLIAGGCVLAFLGVDAGRLICVKGPGGIELEPSPSPLVRDVRKAADEQEREPDRAADPADVLTATAEVLEARTEEQQRTLVDRLERVVNPLQRQRVAVD